MAKAKKKTPTRRTTKRQPAAVSSGLPVEVTAGVAAALDKKAMDLVVLDLRQGSAFTDFFVIATAGNLRQAQAIADGIQQVLRAKQVRPALVEGYERGEWILMDYFDVIFHIFTPATREFYALEKLWGDAERLDLPAS